MSIYNLDVYVYFYSQTRLQKLITDNIYLSI